MYSKEKLETILNEKIISIEETNYGITNKNYLIKTETNKYFYRTPKDETQIVSKENEKEAHSLLKNEEYFLKPVFYNSTHLITEYKENSKTFISQKNLSNIIRIAHLLRSFHNKKFKAKNKFNPISTFEKYLENVDEFTLDISHFLHIVDDFKTFYNPDRLCHNDLVEGNFLFTKNKIYLIDFEYAGVNDYYFDIASFISENNLDYQETITFLKAYFNDEQCNFKKLDTFLRFCDLLWYVWASMLYEKRKEEVYNEIALDKYKNLKSPRKIIY